MLFLSEILFNCKALNVKRFSMHFPKKQHIKTISYLNDVRVQYSRVY